MSTTTRSRPVRRALADAVAARLGRVLATLAVAMLGCSESTGSREQAEEPLSRQIDRADDTEAAYTLGVLTARGLQRIDLSDAEWRAFSRGLSEQRAGGARDDLVARMRALERFQDSRTALAAKRELDEGQAGLASAAEEPDAETLQFGVVSRVLEVGDGDVPTLRDTVTLDVTGRLLDGTVFESTEAEGAPKRIDLADANTCWSQALLRVPVGSKVEVTCPPATTYGAAGRPPLVPPTATVRFELELLEVGRSRSTIHRPPGS